MTSIPSSLDKRFATFAALELTPQNFVERKEAIRSVAGDVITGALALTADQLEACRHERRSLARITAYLFIENDRWKADIGTPSTCVRDEWDRLRAVDLAPPSTLMPLHYALRAYRHVALQNQDASVHAAPDLEFLKSMQSRLAESSLDSGRQVRDILSEIIRILEKRCGPFDAHDGDAPHSPRERSDHASHLQSGDPSKNWITPANVLAIIGLMTAPGLLSMYQSCSAVKTVNAAFLIVATGVEEFRSGSAWTPSETIKDWRESKKRIRFATPVPCSQPDVRVSLSSVDLGSATRRDIAAPDNERTRDGFLLVVRTWGGSSEIPWIKVDWFAACRSSSDPLTNAK